MPRELFVARAFNKGSRQVIRQANAILAEYRNRGFVLTLRQLYYQFVARGFMENEQKKYKQLGSIINDARLAGLIDWAMIEDRTRSLETHASWENPQSIMDVAAEGFALNIWDRQPCYFEVWLEKEALVGVIEPACNELRVPYFACRGYTSQSEQWRAGKRLRQQIDAGKSVIILHLGDHDPSGIDMTRDNDERLALFARSAGVELRRIALNMDQIEVYKPPPNPAKASDTRFAGYVADHGDESWELDALDPGVIDALIRAEIEPAIDWDEWNVVLTEELEAKRVMAAVASRWSDVCEMIDRPDYA